jgi:hypothetical protein
MKMIALCDKIGGYTFNNREIIFDKKLIERMLSDLNANETLCFATKSKLFFTILEINPRQKTKLIVSTSDQLGKDDVFLIDLTEDYKRYIEDYCSDVILYCVDQKLPSDKCVVLPSNKFCFYEEEVVEEHNFDCVVKKLVFKREEN